MTNVYMSPGQLFGVMALAVIASSLATVAVLRLGGLLGARAPQRGAGAVAVTAAQLAPALDRALWARTECTKITEAEVWAGMPPYRVWLPLPELGAHPALLADGRTRAEAEEKARVRLGAYAVRLSVAAAEGSGRAPEGGDGGVSSKTPIDWPPPCDCEKRGASGSECTLEQLLRWGVQAVAAGDSAGAHPCGCACHLRHEGGAS